MILIVDDSPVLLMALRHVFEDRGHVVDSATSGQEALEIIDRGVRPDVMVLDFKMPIMGAPELVDEINRRKINAPIIILSGFVGELKEEFTMRVQGILAKPASSADLIAEVEKYVKPEKLPDHQGGRPA